MPFHQVHSSSMLGNCLIRYLCFRSTLFCFIIKHWYHIFLTSVHLILFLFLEYTALGTKRLASEELVHDWDNKRLNIGQVRSFVYSMALYLNYNILLLLSHVLSLFFSLTGRQMGTSNRILVLSKW